MPLDEFFGEAWPRLQEPLFDVLCEKFSVVRLNSDVCKYRASSVFDVCTRILFIAAAGC